MRLVVWIVLSFLIIGAPAMAGAPMCVVSASDTPDYIWQNGWLPTSDGSWSRFGWVDAGGYESFSSNPYDETQSWTAIKSPSDASMLTIGGTGNEEIGTWVVEDYIWSGLGVTQDRFSLNVLWRCWWYGSFELQSPDGAIIDQWEGSDNDPTVWTGTRSYTLDTIRLPESDWQNGYKLTMTLSMPDPVPEPSSLLVLGGGLTGLIGAIRKRLN